MTTFLSFNLRDKKINAYDTDNPITNLFKQNIFWDHDNYSIFQKYRRPNTNFIDAGGYIGTQSILMDEIMKSENEKNKIYTFEPLHHEVLEMNIIDNNLQEAVTLFKVGLGSKKCKINVWNKDAGFIVGQPGQSLVVINETVQDITQFISKAENENGDIQIETLDSYNLVNIGFIKLDCEGMELDILNGAKNTIINNNFPPLFIEIWKQEGWRENIEYYKNYKDLIRTFLIDLGYFYEERLNYYDHIFLNKEDFSRIKDNESNN